MLLPRSFSARMCLTTVLLGLLAATPTVAQVIIDPGDTLYRHLDVWQKRGYTTQLPYVRPYPMAVVQRALQDVIRNGDSIARELAASYLSEYDPRGIPVFDDFRMFAFEGGAAEEIAGKRITAGGEATTEVRHTMGLAAEAAGWVLAPDAGARADLSYSSQIGLTISSEVDGEVEPLWTTLGGDTTDGGFKVDVLGTTYAVDILSTGAFAVGTDRLFFQAGLARTSYGPFPDRSVVIGPDAPPTGHFSLTWMADWLEASALFLELNASYGVTSDGERYSLRDAYRTLGFPQNTFPGKYLMVHSYRIFPTDFFNLGYFQAVLYGARISPIYFLPFPSMFSQVYVGDYDNSFMGLTTALHFPWDLHVESLFYVDDWNANEILKGRFLTSQSKFAWHSELSWTPQSVVERLSATYLMVSPYMYTHLSTTPFDYLMYTSSGESLGSLLGPNSDLWEVRLDLLPRSFLKSHLFVRGMRHGNASEGVDTVVGDGSIWDDGALEGGGHVFQGDWIFLAQDTLMQVLQAGAGVRLRRRAGHYAGSLQIGCVLEWVRNRDLNPAAPTELNHSFNISLTAGL